MEPRRQEHGPFHGVGRGRAEPADLQVAVGRGAHLRVARDRPPPLVRAEPPAGHVPLVQIHEPGDAPARRRAPALRALGLLVVLVDVPREQHAPGAKRVYENHRGAPAASAASPRGRGAPREASLTLSIVAARGSARCRGLFLRSRATRSRAGQSARSSA